MNSLLILIASLIIFASMSLFGYLVTVVALAFGAIFTTCLLTKTLLVDFLCTNSISVIKEEQSQKDSQSS
ncbi:MAG: hypothetical protein MK008_12785 [Bdellovibrionales bacterium]|nr:hypothetical protein [Bdellovibrionales bacterium]